MENKRKSPLGALSMQVQVRETYGTPRIYPICAVSRALILLTGRKTWRQDDLDHLRSMGMQIEYLPSSLTEEEVCQR